MDIKSIVVQLAGMGGLPLSHILLSVYRREAQSSYRGKRVIYVDGNPFNLRKSNLGITSKIMIDTINLGSEIYIRLRCTDHQTAVAITNCDKGLHEILCNVRWHFAKKDRVFRTTAHHNQKRYLHQLVWAYFEHGANINNWAEAGRRWLKKSTYA